MTRSVFRLLACGLALIAAGCGETSIPHHGNPTPGVDATVSGTDAAVSGDDASAPRDSGEVPDADTEPDASAGEDAGAWDAAVPDASVPDAGPDAGTCENPCGTDCCAPGQTCTNGVCTDPCVGETDLAFCVRLARQCGSVTAEDNCHLQRTVDCGQCQSPQTCNPTTGTCGCVPETDIDFCRSRNRECGPLTGNDNCGAVRQVANCGSCQLTELCEQATGTCELCDPELDTAFCSRLQKECDEVSDLDNCGIPRTVTSCGTCTEPERCGAANQCAIPPPPLNDACSGAEPLVFDSSGLAHVDGETIFATDSGSGRNCQALGPDVVYAFTLGTRKNIDIQISATGFQPVLHVRSACDDPATELSCATGSTGATGVLFLRGLAAGTYYLWVDGHGSVDRGSFTVDAIAVDPSPTPANDSCAAPEPLTFTNGVAMVFGTTDSAQDDATASCGPTGGADLFYSFSLAADSAVIARVTRDESVPTLAPAVYIRSACPGTAADERACGVGVNGTATAAIPVLPTGDYFLVVDGATGTAGGFELEVTILPAVTNDGCSAPQALAFDPTTGTATVQSHTGAATADTSGSCGGSGRDVVYSFTLSGTAGIQAVLTPDSGTALKGTMYLRSSCDQVSSEIAGTCAFTGYEGRAVTLAVPRLAAGTYYLWVDSYSAGTGGYTLSVTRNTNVLNDDCARAQELTFDPAGVANVSGDNTVAIDVGKGSCATSSNGGLVYSMLVRTERRLDAVVTPATGSSFRPLVYLRSTCGSETPEQACVAAVSGGPATLAVPRLAPGLYYLWVDGYSSYRGAFDLHVTLSDPQPRPANDTCGGATPLQFSGNTATVSGSTADATADYPASCGTTSSPINGGDLVYSFSLANPASINAVLASDGTTPAIKPALSLRASCPDAGSEIACKYSTSNPATFSAALDAGTYYLLVAGVSATAGGFTLTVTQNTSVVAGDGCFDAQPMTFVNGVATASGDNTNATNDGQGICSASTSNDVVYTFTTTAEKDIDIVAGPQTGSTFRGMVYLRRTCDRKDTELGCALSPGATTPQQQEAHLMLNRVPAGTYSLWVDGFGTTKGLYTVSVTLTDPQPAPANDLCAGAVTLSLDPVTNVATVGGDTRTAGNDHVGSCGATTAPLRGNDVVYAVTPIFDSMLSAEVTPDAASTSYRPAVYLRSACDSAAASNELACNLGSLGGVSKFTAVPVQGRQTYYVIVDGGGNSSGQFTLKVTATPNVVVPGDACFVAQSLVFDASGTATATGTTATLTNSGLGSCETTKTAPDAVYSFTLPGERDVEIVVEPDSGSPYKPVVYLRTTCDDATTELGCAKSSTTSAWLSFVTLPAGTYYLWVDTYQSFSGPFTVTVNTTEPPIVDNDACAGAEELVFDPTLTNKARASGNTTYAARDAVGSCGGGAERDVVYSFTTSAPSRVVARVVRDGLTPQFRPVVYLRSSCGGGAAIDEVTCAPDVAGSATAVVNTLPAGTWYVWVDGAGGTRGGFDLEVTLEPPVNGPANETCGSAQTLSFASGATTATVLGSTLLAQDESDGSCSAPGGSDVVYAFTTTQPQRIVATVTPSGPGFQPAVYLRRDCASRLAADELACGAAPNDNAPALAEIGNAAAGTYFVWVDGHGSYLSAGNFALEVQLLPPSTP